MRPERVQPPAAVSAAVTSSAPAALVAATVPPAAFEYGDEGFGFRCAGCSGCASESCCIECSSAGFGFCRARCNGHASRSSHRCCPGRCSFCSSLACFSCSCTCCWEWQWRWCCRLPRSAGVRARRLEGWTLLQQSQWGPARGGGIGPSCLRCPCKRKWRLRVCM